MTTVPLQQNLETAIAAAYKAFRAYRAPSGLLDVCTHCCMNAQAEREMRHLPLHALTERHFYEYNDSAKSDVQPAGEIKYFLPRLLELLAQGARLHHSVELYLYRVGHCEPGAFSPKERAALQDVALAHFALGLEQWHAPHRGVFQDDDAFTALLMWDHAGVGLSPLLDHWMACESDSSTLHFVDACFWDYLWNGQQISNAFASDRPDYQATLQAWLADPPRRARWADRLVRLVEHGPACGWLPPGAVDHGHYPLHERIGAVFDAMTA